MKARILLIEDEPDVVELIAGYFKKHSEFSIVAEADGAAGLRHARTETPAAIILDLMLPKMPGLEVCRALRSDPATRNIPILMLTAKAEEVDRIVGLEFGADDYVTKPFSPREVMLRIRAILKRSASSDETPANITAGAITIEPAHHRVTISGKVLDLTATEFKLLSTLVQRRGRVQARDRLLNDDGQGYESIIRRAPPSIHPCADSRRQSSENRAAISKPCAGSAIAFVPARRQMIWIIAILAAASVLGLAVRARKRWILPWPAIAKLVDDIHNVRQPRTYLVEGNSEAKRVALALEGLFLRQRELTEKIGQSEFNVSTILNAMDDGLVVLDENGRIRLTNPAFRRLFALSEDEARATLIEMLRNVAVEQLVQRTLQSGGAANGTISTPGSGATTARHLAVNAVAMRDSAGAIKGAVVLFRDVTILTRERTRNPPTLFVANVSHELRTPLSIFRGYVETLRDDPDVSRDELRRIVDAMESTFFPPG